MQTNPVVVIQALMHIHKSYGDGDSSDGVVKCLAKAIVTNNSLGPIVFITPELGKWSTVGGTWIAAGGPPVSVPSQLMLFC
jgi:hypothetical protein